MNNRANLQALAVDDVLAVSASPPPYDLVRSIDVVASASVVRSICKALIATPNPSPRLVEKARKVHDRTLGAQPRKVAPASAEAREMDMKRGAYKKQLIRSGASSQCFQSCTNSPKVSWDHLPYQIVDSRMDFQSLHVSKKRFQIDLKRIPANCFNTCTKPMPTFTQTPYQI